MNIKFSSLVLTLTITLALSACGNSNKAAVNTTEPVMNPIESSAATTQASTKALVTPAPAPTATPPAPKNFKTPTPEMTPKTTEVKITPSPKATPVATPKPTDAPKTPEPDNAVAEALFKQSCTSCHGVDLGGDFGPNLQKVGGHMTKAQIITQITEGGDAMPAFGNKLDGEEIQALASWLSAKK